MQVQKLKVLVEAGVVRDVESIYQPDPVGWTVQVTYANRTGERREVLERQRGGVRAFATLDAVARALGAAGIDGFRVSLRSGAGSSGDR